MELQTSADRPQFAFFDVETTFPTQVSPRTLVEFGAILVCPRTLVELDSYSTLIRPSDLSLLSPKFLMSKGITEEDVVSAPSFSQIADKVFDLLHGRVWIGHNISRFDCWRINEAFDEIGRIPPEPKCIIDSLTLLTETFGKRAGDMKMASLANYFDLGKQSHRSLDDVRLNFDVLKHCATVLLLECGLPEELVANNWASPVPATRSRTNGSSSSSVLLTPDEVSIDSITASFVPFNRFQRIQILHKGNVFKLRSTNLKVRLGISTMFSDRAGRPKLSFVVDAPPTLSELLDACDNHVQALLNQSGSASYWTPTIKKTDRWNLPTIRLHIPTLVEDNVAKYATDIYHKEALSTAEQIIVFSKFDAEELDRLFTVGSLIDANFSLDPYEYPENAGIRLVAEQLVIQSK